MTVRSVELNITLRCNLRCENCNRLCNIAPLAPDMTVGQVETMVARLKEQNRRLAYVKVVGGEPGLHPELAAICQTLVGAGRATIHRVTVNTNGTVPGDSIPGVKVKPSRQPNKRHAPFLWSPRDFGRRGRGPCRMPFRCGLSLDAVGWLPCSAAIAITRLFNKMHLYRPVDGPVPEHVWGMDELCPDCVFGLPYSWQHKGRDDIVVGRMPAMYHSPSPTWAKALWNYFRPDRDWGRGHCTMAGCRCKGGRE